MYVCSQRLGRNARVLVHCPHLNPNIFLHVRYAPHGLRVCTLRCCSTRRATFADGPGVYMQPYFKAADFPHNMREVWDEHMHMHMHM